MSLPLQCKITKNTYTLITDRSETKFYVTEASNYFNITVNNLQCETYQCKFKKIK